MRTIVFGDDTIRCFDKNVWLQERNLIHFNHKISQGDVLTVSMWTNLQGDNSHPIAKYSLDNNGDVLVDMSDYIRAHPEVRTIYFEDPQDDTIEVPMVVVGLINPMSVLIPDRPVSLLRISPPRMIYAPIGIDLQVEVMRSPFATDSIAVDSTDIGAGLNNVAIGVDFDIENLTEQTVLSHYTLRPQVCGHRYAVVRWTSAFGTTKTFVWEVVGTTTEVGDKISLMPLPHDYKTIKGRVDSFSLFLDNLSSYDMWYYSDIITSGKVEVSFDEGETFRQVDVTTNSVTIPDGDAGKMNELKIAVNYRKYDAATL